jgi:histidine phosphotransfer protein HptB
MIRQAEVIDWTQLAAARARMGAKFWRTLGYLHDEGLVAMSRIENALRAHDPVAMIEPAEHLKDEAMPLGALRLAEIAETIEMQARDCVEYHQDPAPLIETVVQMRTVFDETVDLLQNDANPLIQHRTPARPTGLIAA